MAVLQRIAGASLVFITLWRQFKIKFLSAQFNGDMYIANAICVSTFGLVLGLASIHRASGSWKTTFSLALKFPALLFLPVFGFVTFGPTPKGKAKATKRKLFFCRGRLDIELEMDLGQLCRLPLDQQVDVPA